MSHHATLGERVDYIEGLIGDSIDKHARELEALAASHEKHASAFSKHSKLWEDHKGELSGHHSTLEGRISELEQAFNGYADKHDNHSSSTHARFEHVQGRLAACERFGAQLDELRRLHGGLAKEKQELAGHHSVLKDRLDNLDK